MKLTRLSAADFDRLATEKTELGERAREMARAVLVDGRAQTDVATEYGMTKQRVGLAVSAIKRAYAQSKEPGSGWIEVQMEMPEPLALEVAGLIESLKNCADEAKCSKALAQALHGLSSARKLVE